MKTNRFKFLLVLLVGALAISLLAGSCSAEDNNPISYDSETNTYTGSQTSEMVSPYNLADAGNGDGSQTMNGTVTEVIPFSSNESQNFITLRIKFEGQKDFMDFRAKPGCLEDISIPNSPAKVDAVIAPIEYGLDEQDGREKLDDSQNMIRSMMVNDSSVDHTDLSSLYYLTYDEEGKVTIYDNNTGGAPLPEYSAIPVSA